MNKVELVGRMTRAPELRQSQNGRDICTFSVAVDRDYKNDQGKIEADFPRCIAFDRTADFVARWFGKGKPIEIVGRLSTSSYQNKNGDKVYTTDVIVEKASFVPGSKSDGNNGGRDSYNSGGDSSHGRDNYSRGGDRQGPDDYSARRNDGPDNGGGRDRPISSELEDMDPNSDDLPFI